MRREFFHLVGFQRGDGTDQSPLFLRTVGNNLYLLQSGDVFLHLHHDLFSLGVLYFLSFKTDEREHECSLGHRQGQHEMSGGIRGCSHGGAVEHNGYSRHGQVLFVHYFSLDDVRFLLVVFRLFLEKDDCLVEYPKTESRAFQARGQYFLDASPLEV